jgi:hypothetical protein
MRFEWEPRKAARNRHKHGVSFAILTAEARCGSLVRAGPARMKGRSMKSRSQRDAEDIRPEYDFDYSNAVRGKYFQRLMKEGSNIVVLDPDVAQRFRTSAAVNDALRKFLKATRPTRRPAARSETHERTKARKAPR